MKKIILLLSIPTLFIITPLKAQNISIPDSVFKSHLINDPNINTNGDDEIQLLEAQSFDGGIHLLGVEIYSLAGIEHFSSLTELQISFAPLTHLDLSSNPTLKLLYCSDNKLTTLNISNNASLIRVYCSNNALTELDLSSNTALATLDVYNNSLSELDLQFNSDLRTLDCTYNELSFLDISANHLLSELSCSFNNLSELDVSTNPFLTALSTSNNNLLSIDVKANSFLTLLMCNNNYLSELDISKNTALTNLICYNNNLTALDASKNIALVNIYTSNNSLTTLNLQNGNNTNIEQFDARNNPNLNCIQVDDIAYSNSQWLLIDPHTIFSKNCGIDFVDDYTMWNRQVVAYPNPSSRYILFDIELSKNSTIKIELFDLAGKQLYYENKNGLAGSRTYHLSLEEIPPGLYFYTVSMGNNIQQGKLSIR